VDVAYQYPDGRVERVVKTSPVQTRRGAEEYERQVRAALLAGTYRRREEQREPAPTLARFVEDRWWGAYPESAGNRPTTIKDKRWALDRHILPELGERRLDQIGAEAIERLAASLYRKGLCPKVVKNLCSVLRRVLTSAVEWGALEALPRFPRIKVPEQDFDFFEPEESERLLAGANEDDRLLLMFALKTGARAGEQIAVEWGDIDWTRHEVAFRRSRPSTTHVTGATKTGRVRRVPLTATLETALRRARHLRGSLVFCRSSGAHLENWELHAALARARKRSGVRRLRTRGQWHGLRHSFASQAVAAGAPINLVQAWMGHSTIAMTMRYAHLAPNAGARWIGVLDGASANLTRTQAETGTN
jgi:integrase